MTSQNVDLSSWDTLYITVKCYSYYNISRLIIQINCRQEVKITVSYISFVDGTVFHIDGKNINPPFSQFVTSIYASVEWCLLLIIKRFRTFSKMNGCTQLIPRFNETATGILDLEHI
jgi:hypothetical protein